MVAVDSRTLAPGQDGYPSALAIAYGPESAPVLRLRGRIPRLPAVVIVGSRDASDEGAAFAYSLAKAFAHDGFAVWSGGACGIDTSAHEGALDGRGATVVVLGSGLTHPYPAANVPLFQRVIREGGALVSLRDDDARPTPGGFLERNRALAAGAACVIVVEAGVRSGARRAIAAARKLGKPIGIVPHSPWAERGAGCALELAAGGAFAIATVEGGLALARAALEDALPEARRARRAQAASARALRLPFAAPGEESPRGPAAPPGRAARRAHASAEAQPTKPPVPRESPPAHDAAPPHPAEEPSENAAWSPTRLACVDGLGLDAAAAAACKAIVSALNHESRDARPRPARSRSLHVDELCERTGLAAAVVAEALLTLTLAAVVVEAPGGHYELSGL